MQGFFLIRISEIFCQSQNFLFQKGIEHIIACVAPMHAIELKTVHHTLRSLVLP